MSSSIVNRFRLGRVAFVAGRERATSAAIGRRRDEVIGSSIRSNTVRQSGVREARKRASGNPLGGVDMRFLHAMVRVLDLEAAISFFGLLGLREVRRTTSEAGRHTLVWLSTGHPDDTTRIELTHNWDQKKPYTQGKHFGHLAYEVEDIYAVCARLARRRGDDRAAAARRTDGVRPVARRPVGRAPAEGAGAPARGAVGVDEEHGNVVIGVAPGPSAWARDRRFLTADVRAGVELSWEPDLEVVLHIARPFGIPVHVHWSFFGLLAGLLAYGVLPRRRCQE